MTPVFTLLSSRPYLLPPEGWLGWLGWLALAAAVLACCWRWRRYSPPWRGSHWVWLFALIALSLPSSLFLGVRFPVSSTLPLPEVALEPPGALLMILGGVPWALAALLLGPWPAAVVAFCGALFTAAWHSHHPFYPLEVALLAALWGAALRQRYRTLLYHALRQPLVSALLVAVLFPPLHLVTTMLMSRGSLVTRLDFALTNLTGYSLAFAGEVILAAGIAQAVAWVGGLKRLPPEVLQPSPIERSLGMRFLVSLMPLALVLAFALMVSDWVVAGAAARRLLKAQLDSAGQVAAQSVPYFLQSGQNLILEVASQPQLRSEDPQAVGRLLEQKLRQVPFFYQFILVDEEKIPFASYPSDALFMRSLSAEERAGIEAALNGLPFQYHSIPPGSGQATAQISFIAAVSEADGRVRRVLIGRCDLETNPLTQPILASLSQAVGEDGQGLLIDEDKRILVHPDPQRVMQPFLGEIESQASFSSGVGEDGRRVFRAVYPAQGQPWTVVLVVPASRVQQLALSIAAPLLVMIVLLSAVGMLVLGWLLRNITQSLQSLSAEAARLAEGDLERPISESGNDEVGQLGRAFEQMRLSLKARLDELNRLLSVSQGVASSFEIAEAVEPVLQAALAPEAAAARLVLLPAAIPSLEGEARHPLVFAAGPSQHLYQELDEQIVTLCQRQERLVLANINRPRLFTLLPGVARPESLIAVALRHESQYYGALWVAYDQPHTFSEQEVRFLATLAGQAALAVANVSLFLSAEIGRRRLESILASSPDPILVTDQNNRLLLANPAAWQALSLGTEAYQGQSIEKVIVHPTLLELLRHEGKTNGQEKKMVEVTLPGKRVFLASATSVLAEGRRVGRVCVLHDVTRFKEVEALKTEFVANVSHDLRSPLTLIRGYASMIEMVGPLNEQQAGYLRKIISGIDGMARLVNNLLNLGRIEAGIGLQLEQVSVGEVVERVVSGLQLQAAQKRIHLNYEVPSQAPLVIEADVDLLQQALQNLVENAIKFTKAEGRVSVQVHAQADEVLIQVMDNGSGISPIDMPRLFEKFYRGAHGGAGKGERGAGLGLAIVKSVAERHHGRVWAESQLGKGSTFFLALPLRQPGKAAERG